MDVPRNGIGAFDTTKKVTMAVREERHSTPCGINVEPKSMGLAEVSELRQRVNSANAGRASRCDYKEWRMPFATILLDSRCQITDRCAKVLVGRNSAQGI